MVLAGYDEESALVSDTHFEELQRTSLEGLALARHEQHPFYPLAGHMVDLPPGAEVGDLREAAPRAIARAARRMLEPDLGDFEGLPALRRLAAEIADWPADAPDALWCARFNYQVIERRGTGGGNFRPMYARFLREVGRGAEAELAERCASCWTALAGELFAVSEGEQGDVASWSLVSQAAAPSSWPRSGSGTRSPDDRARKPGPGPEKFLDRSTPTCRGG